MDGYSLERAAAIWARLAHYQYIFTYGKKRKLYSIKLTFEYRDFPHVAGFQYLKDLTFPKYSTSKMIPLILDGTIQLADVKKSRYYQESMEPRLRALCQLEDILDHDFKYYAFMPKFYNFHTTIRADYLIFSQVYDQSFVFMIHNGMGAEISYTCCSAFIKDLRDYTQNQRPLAMLKKEKISLETGETTVLLNQIENHDNI
jgi:hypothetical protein